MSATGQPWWSDAVGYQIYLPSFSDGDGDGWGDLPGVINKLDYLQWLGVDLLWITPFYVSPMRDHGYDIADYRDIDPRFGTLADIDRLLAEAHARGLRVIGDLVVNHTSSAHPWFRESGASRDSAYRDYYIWRPGRGDQPPNNWVATFGGPAWTQDPRTGEWYAHLFTADQPDLNWTNPKVGDEVESIMRFWLDRGLDGFRVDTAHYLAKHPNLLDNPLLPDHLVRIGVGGVADWQRYDHQHDIGQPALREIHRRWRTVVDEYDAFLVGETHILDPAVLAGHLDAQDGLQSFFYFGLIDGIPSAGTLGDRLLAAASASGHLSWAQGNHDRDRAATRYGGGNEGRDRALALVTLMLGLPGTPFLYQGEELGLENGAVPPDRAQDPLVLIGNAPYASRDPARTPMPWRPVPGLGFTTAAEGWLPDGGRQANDTVDIQRADPRSWLNLHRDLLQLRRQLRSALREPVDRLNAPAGVTAYRSGSAIFAANLGDVPAMLRTPADALWQPRFHTTPEIFVTPGGLRLPPNSAAILVAENVTY